MEIKKIVLGPIESNCYIVSNQGECIIIDPGFESPLVADYITKKQLKPVLIYATHGHFDHVGGINALKTKYHIPAYAPFLDDIWFGDDKLNYTGKKVDIDFWVNDGDEIILNEIIFKVMATPGHSLGSTALYFTPYLFVGDTLFKQGIGRTDLPYGSFPDILNSIKMLYQLPDNTKVYPGHGENTTIAFEKKYNPFING